MRLKIQPEIYSKCIAKSKENLIKRMYKAIDNPMIYTTMHYNVHNTTKQTNKG